MLDIYLNNIYPIFMKKWYMYDEYDIVHPNLVKYSQKCRTTQSSDINVSFILCQILRVVSTLLKCHCNLQSNMRGLSVMPYLFIHNLFQAFPDKIFKNFQNVDRYKHVFMKIYRVIREECTCYMVCNSHKIHDVERMFLGRNRSIHTAKK